MINTSAPIVLKVGEREFNIPRPTVLQFNVAKLTSLQTLQMGYTARYLTSEHRAISDHGDSETDIQEMSDCLTLVEKTAGLIQKRLRFWLAACAEAKELLELIDSQGTGTEQDLVYSTLLGQALEQIRGSEKLVKN